MRILNSPFYSKVGENTEFFNPTLLFFLGRVVPVQNIIHLTPNCPNISQNRNSGLMIVDNFLAVTLVIFLLQTNPIFCDILIQLLI
jgi:hypothetical protein